MRYLEDRTVPDKEETVLAPMSDSKALAQYEQNGGHKPGVGVYAISYGVGGQSIGQSSLTFQSYDFSAGSQLTVYLSFVNTGDVAIRASEKNPAVVELKLYVPAAAENTGSTSTLATWNLTENLRSGQKAVLDGSCAALTRDLPNGSIFYIEVREDADYIASTGGAAFEASTLVVDENGTPTGGDLVVEPKPDLALEDLHITSVNADSNGNTILQVEFLAANRGSVTAEGVFAKFRYEDGDGSYQPLDISNSDLNISAPAQIAPFSLRDADPRTQGILYLHSGEVDDDGSLPAGMYRKVSGTITVPPSVYQGKLTGSLNLHIELFSNADPQINTHDTAAYHAEHGEYNSANNAAGEQIEHKTFFTAADQVILALGTTVRLPVSYTTTTGYAPNILAEEVPDVDGDGAQLGILYYESTGSGSGMVVITPSAQGTGIIHLKDEGTNTIWSIPFKVVEPGEGIDIYKDNGIFTFYNQDGTPYDDTAQAGSQSWSFVENIFTWGTGDTQEVPMRSDLSKGKVGSYFTFSTMAASMELYFAGSAEVSSTFPGFAAASYTGTEGKRPVTIRFGENPNNIAHTVTVKVTGAAPGGGGYAYFDRMTETYTQKPPTPSDDGTAPHIYWSRSFPDTASLQTGAGPVELTCYVLDDGALADLTLNGTEPAGLTKTSGGFWQFTTTVSENGVLLVAATDTAGNRTSRTVRVDWFNAVPATGAISTAPTLDGQFQTESGSELTGYLTKGSRAYLAATTPAQPEEGQTLTASRLTAHETAEGTSELEEVSLTRQGDGRFDATANGWYILRLEAQDHTWRQVVLEMDKVDADAPVVSLTESGDGDQWSLLWSASKSNPRLTPISKVQINGETIPVSARQTQLAGTWPISYSGKYTLTATDEAGNESEITCLVENSRPLDLSKATGLVSVENSWNQAADNGSVTVDLTGVTGGKYVAETFENSKQYAGRYEFRIMPAGVSEEPADDSWQTWDSTPVQLANLRTGEHLLCIRDEQDPQNEKVAVSHPFTVGSDAVSFAATVTNASSDSASNGAIDVEASGGKDKLGLYQLLIRPLDGENSPLMPVDRLTEGWQSAAPDSEDLSQMVLDGLRSGWYQVAVRAMTGVRPDELETLRELHAAMTDAQLRADAAAEALKDREEAEGQLQSRIHVAFSQWNAAISAANAEGLNEEQKAAAEAAVTEARTAYEALVENDTALLAALDAWRGKPDDPDLESAYNTALTAYVQKRVKAEAEAEKAAADTALEGAVSAYEAKKAAVDAAVDTAYAEDAPLWTNAFTSKLYVGSGHTHVWSASWSSNSTHHWHGCTAEGCDISADSGKSGYAAHVPGAAAACETAQACSVCGYVLAAALGHDYGEKIPAKDATTTSTGMRAHYVCSRCSGYFDENKRPTTADALTIPKEQDSDDDTYAVTAGKAAHGKVTASPSNAASGSTVTLTVVPDKGYQLDILSVTDARGKQVKLTSKGNGKYTFTMPGGAIAVAVTFVPLSDDGQEPCDGGADCPSHSYTDLGGTGAWYHDAVDYALHNGLINGYGSDSFGPNDALTRAQLAQILFNKAGRPAVTGSGAFADVAPGQWYANAIQWAGQNGIVNGQGNGLFGPDDDITREQLAVMLWRYAGRPAATSTALPFDDTDKISGYALDAVRWAVENGILKGYGGGRLGPQDRATRAQAAQMLKNLFER